MQEQIITLLPLFLKFLKSSHVDRAPTKFPPSLYYRKLSSHNEDEHAELCPFFSITENGEVPVHIVGSIHNIPMPKGSFFNWEVWLPC